MLEVPGTAHVGRAMIDSKAIPRRGPHDGAGSSQRVRRPLGGPTSGGTEPRPLRILFIITRADSIGGAQIHVRDLTGALAREGHEIMVVSGVGSPFTEALGRSGIETRGCPALQREIRPLADLRALKDLRGIIKRYRPDLVSTHTAKAGFLGRLACMPLDIPCLFTAHGWAFSPGVPEPRRTMYQWFERLAAPLSDKIICVSEHDRGSPVPTPPDPAGAAPVLASLVMIGIGLVVVVHGIELARADGLGQVQTRGCCPQVRRRATRPEDSSQSVPPARISQSREELGPCDPVRR